MNAPANRQKIWDTIKQVKIGMLVTQDQNELRARPMHLVQNSYDGKLWFFTPKHSAKVNETQQENQVCITYTDSSKDIQLSLSGHARLSEDLVKMKELWNPMIGAWFEGDYTSPEVALLEITIEQGELWETKDNKLVQLFKMAKAAVSDEKPDLGHNEKFG